MAEEIKYVQSAEQATVTTVRKRGRPRKDESRGSDYSSRKYQKTYQGSQSQFGSVYIGQPVSGVLDGKFDAGYMLTVRVGNTGTVLRGVVFEPGRVVPVSSSNDIAPQIPMAPRAAIPIPGGADVLNPSVRNKIASIITPPPILYATTGEKVGAPAMSGTVVVPVTLSPALPLQNPPVETLKNILNNQPSPVVSVKQSRPENDSKNILTPVESNTVPQTGFIDAAGQSSTFYSKNILTPVESTVLQSGFVDAAGPSSTLYSKNILTPVESTTVLQSGFVDTAGPSSASHLMHMEEVQKSVEGCSVVDPPYIVQQSEQTPSRNEDVPSITVDSTDNVGVQVTGADMNPNVV